MSSWSDLIKNNNQNTGKSSKSNNEDNGTEKTNNEDDELFIHHTFGLKNEEEEFDYKYSDNLTNIIVEFNDLLNTMGVNVMNNKISGDLFDFIKYNCYNYDDVIDEVDKYNDALEKEYEEELEEEEEKNYYYR